MSDVAVIFGGPSPEHDVSVLTGLQAARGLTGGAGAPVGSVRALFWSKTGEWFEVDPGLEAEAFLEGVPRGATRLQFVAAPGGGFAEPGGVSGGRGPSISTSPSSAATAAPARTAPCRPPSTSPASATPGPTVAGAALGMDKLAFGAVVGRGRPPDPAPRTCWRAEADAPAFAGPYIVKPRFGGSSIGIDVVEDFDTALARLAANPHLGFGAVLEPYRPDMDDLQIGVRTWPTLAALGRRAPHPLRRRRPTSSTTATSTWPAKGMAGAERELPAADPVRAREGAARGRRADRRARRGPRRGPDRLPLRRDGVRRQRGQHHPRVAGPLPVGGARAALRHPARPTCSRRPASAPPTPTRRPVPTAPCCDRPVRSPASWAERWPVRRLSLLPDRGGPGRHHAALVVPGRAAGRSRWWRSRSASPSTSGFPTPRSRSTGSKGVVVAVPCLWLAARVVRWRTDPVWCSPPSGSSSAGGRCRGRASRSGSPRSRRSDVVQSLLRRLVGTGRLELVLWEDGEVRRIDDVRKPVVLQRVITRRLRPPPDRSSRAVGTTGRGSRGEDPVDRLDPPGAGRQRRRVDGARAGEDDHAAAEAGAGHPGAVARRAGSRAIRPAGPPRASRPRSRRRGSGGSRS